ncbi:protein kinase domain-containing protein [Streptomonospora wellingtoniae]|uniref:non-specific serine/threonine protein kinase n=1 Tax=Streptomonospora wellingtoniae TaxID=3075544 RepID=A0ABU2KTI0_9ACTN|nr:protein kinase [Streptomonospora sp. DSM 45055]MDT0302516.1 protein kinase [Streptomonospora sp. DSM 45055]
MSGAEHDSSLAPGFHSLEVVHRGAASTVYRALRDGSGEPAALKVMRDDGGEAEIERLRELARLPGMVAVLGRGRTSSGRAFVAMDYCPDGDYAANLRRRHPLPVEEVVRAGVSAASALHAVHEQGLLYHGVEPGNLLRCPDGAVLADAGAVRPAGEPFPAPGPDPDAVLHAPPEALRGESAAPASDVYRLASTLWTLLAGYPPFGEGPDQERVDPFDYRDKALGAAPPRLPRADLPGALRPVFGRALAKAPDERYATAADFAAALSGDAVAHAAPAGERAPEPEPDPGAAAESAADTVAGAVPEGPAPPPRSDASGEEERGGAAEPAGHGAAASGPAPCGDGVDAPARGPGDGSAQWAHAVQEAVDTLRGTGGQPGAGTGTGGGPAAPGGLPEDAWAGLAGWTGSHDPHAPHTGASGHGAGSAGLPDGSGATSWSGGGGLPFAAAQEPGPTFAPPQAPAAPEPPAAPAARPVRRRPLYIAVAVVAIGFVVVTVGAVAILRPGLGGDLMEQAGAGEGPSPAPNGGSGASGGPSGPPAPAAGTNPAAAPTGVALDDSGDTVVVTWTDNSGGGASHHVIGGPVGTTPANLADAEAGATEATVSGLNASQEYCFTVVAVLSVDEIARSDEVCTERGTG